MFQCLASRSAAEEWARWILRSGWYDWFVTLTLVEGGEEQIERYFRIWLGAINTTTAQKVEGFACMEYQRRGTPHIHALLRAKYEPSLFADKARPNKIATRRLNGAALWQQVSKSYAQIWPAINDKGGACRYVSKYVAKDSLMNIIGNPTRQLHNIEIMAMLRCGRNARPEAKLG